MPQGCAEGIAATNSGDTVMCSFTSRILLGGFCLLAAVGLRADSTDGAWRYVPLTKLADNPLYATLIEKGNGNPTGVITNGDWQLFVIQGATPGELELNIRTGGWAANDMCAWIAGSGTLDLSKPILSEDGQTGYSIATMSPNALRYGCVVTNFTAPATLKTLGNYIFYQNSTNIVSATFDCPHVTVVGSGILLNKPQLDNMKSLVLNFPNATNVLDSAFYSERASTTTFKVSLPKVTAYGERAFQHANLSLVSQDDLNLRNVRTIGTNAFYASSQSSGEGWALKADTLRLDSLERLEYGSLCYVDAKTVVLGRDNLRWVGARALFGRMIPQIVFGTSPAGTEFEGSVSPVYATGGAYRYWFSGARPATRKTSEDDALLSMKEDCQGMVFIPYGEESWSSLVSSAREPAGEERTRLAANYPDVAEERIIGVIEPDAAGGGLVSHRMFLAYGDYRTREHLLYVRGYPAEYAAGVSPAYGMTDEYGPGETVSLSAPATPVQAGESQVRAVKYVVEELDALGRWTKAVTNAYGEAGAQIAMPASGTSLRVTWIFESAHELALSLDAGYRNETVEIAGASLDGGKAVLAHGSSVTLTAREESDEIPKAHFAFWQGDIGDADPSNHVLTLVMDRPRQVTAVFDHDWYIGTVPDAWSDGTMTDGKWTVRFLRRDDSGQRRTMNIGKSWDIGAVVSGAGRINLDTRITDADGSEWVADSMESNAFRFTAAGDQQNVVTDCTFPKTLTRIGRYVFYGCTSVTNVVVDCPLLTEAGYGHFYECTNLQRLKFKCDILEDFDLRDGKDAYLGLLGRPDYATPSASARLEELELFLPALKCVPPNFCCAGPLTRTDATAWRFDSATNVCTRAFFAKTYAPGPYGTLSLSALETISGYRIAWSRGFDAIRLGSGELRDLGRTVQEDGVSYDVMNEFRDCRRLGRIEIGLASNAYLEPGLFSGEGLTGITNVTFTGAAPSGPELFAGLAVRAPAGRTVRFYASRLQPGWTEADFPATCAAAGIVPRGQMSDEDRAAVRGLPREERRQFMGLVYDGKPFGWLFDTVPWSAGFRMIVK